MNAEEEYATTVDLFDIIDIAQSAQKIKVSELRRLCRDRGIVCSDFLEAWMHLCEASYDVIDQAEENILSIDDALPEWDALRKERYYDNRPIPKPESTLVKPKDVEDNVNKPLHYRIGEVEAIDYIHQQLGTGVKDYLLGNVHSICTATGSRVRRWRIYARRGGIWRS